MFAVKTEVSAAMRFYASFYQLAQGSCKGARSEMVRKKMGRRVYEIEQQKRGILHWWHPSTPTTDEIFEEEEAVEEENEKEDEKSESKEKVEQGSATERQAPPRASIQQKRYYSQSTFLRRELRASEKNEDHSKGAVKGYELDTKEEYDLSEGTGDLIPSEPSKRHRFEEQEDNIEPHQLEAMASGNKSAEGQEFPKAFRGIPMVSAKEDIFKERKLPHTHPKEVAMKAYRLERAKKIGISERSDKVKQPVDIKYSDAVRQTMRKVPTPIAVVTSSNPFTQQQRGMTISSFTTVTLDPFPVISFNLKSDPQRPSRMLSMLHYEEPRAQFFLHLLAATPHGARLADYFTTPRGCNLESLEPETVRLFANAGAPLSIHPTPIPCGSNLKWNLPLLRSKAVGQVFRCELVTERVMKTRKHQRIGDHLLVLAKVVEVLPAADEWSGKMGLSYMDGKYRCAMNEQIDLDKGLKITWAYWMDYFKKLAP